MWWIEGDYGLVGAGLLVFSVLTRFVRVVHKNWHVGADFELPTAPYLGWSGIFWVKVWWII